MIRVFLCDDHVVLRQGLRNLLERDGEIRVVGEAGDVASTIKNCLRLLPDVLVLDLALPDGSGVEVARHLGRLDATPAIVVLTMHREAGYLKELFHLGVRGFVLKTADEGELSRAIHAAAKGRLHVDPELAGELVCGWSGSSSWSQGTSPDRLTGRERQVLADLARGFTNQEISGRLGVSVRTVETHRARIQRKLDLHSRAELVRWSLDHGLMPMS